MNKDETSVGPRPETGQQHQSQHKSQHKSQHQSQQSQQQQLTSAQDGSKEGRTALHFASAIGHLQIVKLLIQSGASPNTLDDAGYSSLHHAATEGHVDVVKYLIRHGAKVDQQDLIHGNSAIHEAAWNGYSKTIEVLTKAKANLNLKNKNGNSGLHLACQQGHNQSCRNLLIHGAKPDIKNNYGDTPLHTAARYGHAGVVRILISAFCNINEVNKNGDTALHISSAMGRRKLTKILLETGCDPAIKNKQGETAMDIALRKNFKEVQEIIAAIPVKDPPQVKRTKHTNGSIPSQESRQSREKKHKQSKSKETKPSFHSPYGCPMSPDAKEFPKPRIDSLPSEPLRKGEQYYIDLAGNIRKGPIGRVYSCYCAPLIEKVEAKIEKETKELKEEIKLTRGDLSEKISSLERKTNIQLVSLNETVKSRLAAERFQCIERTQRCNLKQRLDFERSQLQQVEQLKNQMKCWLESRLNQPTPTVQPRKYQQNRAANRSNQHHNGLNGFSTEGHRGSSYQLTTTESELVDAYDRPKSCLSYNKEFCSDMMASSYQNGLRSKSETHLALATESENQVTSNGISGTTEAEVYTYKDNHSCSEDSDEEDISGRQAISSSSDIKNIYDRPTGNGHHHHHHQQQQQIQSESNHQHSSGSANHVDQHNHHQHIVSSAENDHAGDLMKSLRCNNVPRPETDYRNSPFSDSGFRSKYSPSPRDNPLTDIPSVYPEIKLRSDQQQHNHQPPSDPPIGLPTPSIHQLNERPPYRREPIPTRIVTPASSLV